MRPQLFGHPFSSYTMKALIALYENETPFDFRILDQDHPENAEELARRWRFRHRPAPRSFSRHQPQFWMNLQAMPDLAKVRLEHGTIILSC